MNVKRRRRNEWLIEVLFSSFFYPYNYVNWWMNEWLWVRDAKVTELTTIRTEKGRTLLAHKKIKKHKHTFFNFMKEEKTKWKGQVQVFILRVFFLRCRLPSQVFQCMFCLHSKKKYVAYFFIIVCDRIIYLPSLHSLTRNKKFRHLLPLICHYSSTSRLQVIYNRVL